MKRRTVKYSSDLPKRMYSFFISYSENSGAPSFQKFAKSVGLTTDELEKFKKHSEFMRAYRECSEIRRDYLIDMSLSKRFDSSLTKFILTNEFGMDKAEASPDENELKVTLEVLEN